jgi:catalase
MSIGPQELSEAAAPDRHHPSSSAFSHRQVRGLMSMQDLALIEKMAHFNRERIVRRACLAPRSAKSFSKARRRCGIH